MAKKFRKRAMEIYGYKKGSVKAALEDALKHYVNSGEAYWEALKGCMKSELTSAGLQHGIWKKID